MGVARRAMSLGRCKRLLHLFLFFAPLLFWIQGERCFAQIELSDVRSHLWTVTTSLAADSAFVVAGSPDGVRVYARSGHAGFEMRAQIAVDRGVMSIALSGPVAFLVDGAGAVRAIRPMQADSSTTPVPVLNGPSHRAIAVMGLRLIVAGDTEAASFDITNPDNPVPLSSLPLPGAARHVATSGSLALVSCGENGLVIFTVGTDGALQQAGTYTPVAPGGTPHVIRESVTDGRYAWIPAGVSGVLTVDLRTPSSPVTHSRILTFGDARHLALEGDRLLIADRQTGILTYRVTSDGGHFYQSEYRDLKGTRVICAVSPSRFYSTDGGHIMALDAGPLGAISVAGHTGYPGGYNSIAHHAGWVYIPDGAGFWRIHADSVHADSSFVRFGSTPVFGAIGYDGFLYTVNGPDGVRRYRVFENGLTVLQGTISARSSVTGLAIDRDTALVLEDGEGYRLFDVSVPSQPTVIGQDRKNTLFPSSVFPSSRVMYVAEGTGIVQVYDLRFPVKPERVRAVPGTERVRQMQTERKTLYAADLARGFLVYDISNQLFPLLVANPASPARLRAFWRSGRTLYAGGPDGVLTAHDLSAPSSLPLLSSLDLVSEIRAIRKIGEQVFVVTESAVHILSPGLPLVPGDFDANGVTNAEDLVALVDYTFGTGLPPWRPNAADVNADGRSNLQDVVRMVDFLYGDGTPLLAGVIE